MYHMPFFRISQDIPEAAMQFRQTRLKKSSVDGKDMVSLAQHLNARYKTNFNYLGIVSDEHVLAYESTKRANLRIYYYEIRTSSRLHREIGVKMFADETFFSEKVLHRWEKCIREFARANWHLDSSDSKR